MTNKEFQNILAQYPDDYQIQMDNAFGWETPSNKYKVDPHLYVNTDCGFIEIEPPEIRDIWIKPEDELPTSFISCIFLEKFQIDNDVWDFTTQMGTFNPDSKKFCYWDYYEDNEVKVKPERIFAWMPIPKYEGEY